MIQMTADFSSETMEATRQDNIVKTLKENPQILYLAKRPYVNEGDEMKMCSDNGKWGESAATTSAV